MTKTNVYCNIEIAAMFKGPRGTGRTLNNDKLPRCALILCLHVEASIMLRAFLIAALVAGILAKDTYVVVSPAKLRPGMDLSVSVNILDATADVSVTASVVRTSNNSEIVSATKTFRQGHPGAIDLQIPDHLTSSGYELHVSGSGGLTFANKTTLTFSAKSKSIFVQTDKAMYKPGQTVNFRVFAAYPDLQLYTGPINIEIFDPNTNKIKQWLAESATDGVITKELELSTLPVMGDWKIKATVDSSTEEKVFTVAEYVLPKFEVSVELPSYVLTTAESIPVSVTAKYTYGQPVAGPVTVEVKLASSYYQRYEGVVQQTVQLDGEGKAKIVFPMTEIRRLSNNAVYTGAISFTANVTETLTGITLSGSSEVTTYSQPYKLEFLTSNPKTFKPGLEYTAYLKISQPDGQPVSNGGGKTATLQTTVTSQVEEKTTPYPYYYPQTTSFNLSPKTLPVPENGLIAFALSVPANATSLNIHAEYGGVSAYSNIERSYSPSNNYIQLFLRTTVRIQAGGQVDFEVRSTESVNDLVYQILSRGSIVTTGKVSAGGVTSFLFSTPVTSAMAPNSRIVLYYVRADGEIVTDSISFDVDGVFKNQVSVSVDRTEAQPAENVQVKVTATPRSTAYLLAVDQSVLLLKSGNDITQEQVIGELKTYDTIETERYPVIDALPFGAIARRKRMIWFPFPRYYGGSDANQIFKNAGVVVMTDALIYQYVKPYYNRCPFCQFALPGAGGVEDGMFAVAPLKAAFIPGGGVQEPVQEVPALQEVEHVRAAFPETWLWSRAETSADGTATLNTTVPDTITSWIISSFAVSPTAGLGVVSSTAKLRVFRPFFVSLNLPYSVTRGEQVVVQAIVFNYMDQDMDVRVTLGQSQDFYNLIIDDSGNEDMRHEDQAFTVRVAAGQGKSVYFPIVPAILGYIDLIVSAQSTRAADAVRRQLLVKAEGVPKQINVAVLVDLKTNHSFSRTVPISLPPNVVADSQRARVTAIGDLMGPSVNGLDKLLTMPTGCGEQNMIGMAPDVFVYSYLSATHQLNSEIQEKAIKYMEQGYQRELTYQHKDGSFSAFGDQDDSGSMWLTAFVAKCFHQARPYIFIDDKVLDRAIKWVVERQASDGSFPEPGRVIHTDMQGGSSSGAGLTAFVLISLLENNDLPAAVNQLIEGAKLKAISYLKQNLHTITDVYLLAMTTYALTLARDPSAETAFTRLQERAIVKEGMKYWHKETGTSTTTTRYWQNPQASSRDVEMTAYALLTYAASNKFIEGLDVMKWVASQRNPNGGFSSTQDTILALQSLSEFARLAYSNSFNVEVAVMANSFSRNFSISQTNALVLQSAELPSIPSEVTVKATGSGLALVEVAVFFNVEAEVEEPKFDMTVKLLEDTINLLRLETCARWLASGKSGMAVQEVGVPSGFEIDKDTLKSATAIKRTETQDSKLVLYFDEIGTTPVCVTMSVVRTGMVAKSKPVAVRVYDYYEPGNQATAFYESARLKSSSVCDVCQECSCPASRRR